MFGITIGIVMKCDTRSALEFVGQIRLSCIGVTLQNRIQIELYSSL